MGTIQKGRSDLRLASLQTDLDLIQLVREVASLGGEVAAVLDALLPLTGGAFAHPSVPLVGQRVAAAKANLSMEMTLEVLDEQGMFIVGSVAFWPGAPAPCSLSSASSFGSNNICISSSCISRSIRII